MQMISFSQAYPSARHWTVTARLIPGGDRPATGMLTEQLGENRKAAPAPGSPHRTAPTDLMADDPKAI
jgi:hypothetical protein